MGVSGYYGYGMVQLRFTESEFSEIMINKM